MTGCHFHEQIAKDGELGLVCSLSLWFFPHAYSDKASWGGLPGKDLKVVITSEEHSPSVYQLSRN